MMDASAVQKYWDMMNKMSQFIFMHIQPCPRHNQAEEKVKIGQFSRHDPISTKEQAHLSENSILFLS